MSEDRVELRPQSSSATSTPAHWHLSFCHSLVGLSSSALRLVLSRAESCSSKPLLRFRVARDLQVCVETLCRVGRVMRRDLRLLRCRRAIRRHLSLAPKSECKLVAHVSIAVPPLEDSRLQGLSLASR